MERDLDKHFNNVKKKNKIREDGGCQMPEIFEDKKENKITASQFLKEVDSLVDYFFKPLEIRVYKEIEFSKSIPPLTKYILLESQFIKTLFTSHIMQYMYHPERMREEKSDKDFFISFFETLKTKDGKFTDQITNLEDLIGKTYYEKYSKILSEEIDRFLDLICNHLSNF